MSTHNPKINYKLRYSIIPNKVLQKFYDFKCKESKTPGIDFITYTLDLSGNCIVTADFYGCNKCGGIVKEKLRLGI